MTAALRPYLRAIAFWVLFAPFLMLSALSSSVMPVRNADGTMTLVLCTDGDVKEMTIDLATGEPVEKDPSDRSDRCDWACSQWAVADLAHPEGPAAPLHLYRAERPVASVAVTMARVTGLPPSTGPPATA